MTRPRTQGSVPDTVDVAVVGAGLSGLVAAAYLARAGRSVAVFDPHYVAGGCTTQFHRPFEGGNLRFDVGLHYIGETSRDGYVGRILAELGVQQEFEPLDPNGYDEFVFPDFRFLMPADHDLYRQRLIDLFPSERSGIDRYLRYLAEAARARHIITKLGCDVNAASALKVLRRAPGAALRLNWTLGRLLRTCTKDPKLKAVIAAQHGDYGVPPGKVPAIYHAGIVDHFSRGAFYPRGGGQAISDKLALAVEAAGGSIHLRRGISRILIEGGRAVGVRCEEKRGDEIEVRARAVISCADLSTTLLDLVGPEHLPSKLVRRVKGWSRPPGVFMTFLGVRGDLRDRGLSNRNCWQFDDYDFDGTYAAVDRDDVGPAHGVYVTSASLKDPTGTWHGPEGVSTVELMALTRGDSAGWGVEEDDVGGWAYRRDVSYLELKQRVEDDLIARMDRLFPGTASDVVFRESATPVSLSRYTRAAAGTGYGLSVQRGQFARQRPGCDTVVPGLFVCGASTRNGPGIVAVALSGRHAADLVAGDLGHPLDLSWDRPA